MESTIFRQLTDSEIAILKKNGCRAESWHLIEVIDGFNPEMVHNCNFLERARIGVNVRLSDIGVIANYSISSNSTIERVGELVVLNSSYNTNMGNGTEVSTINENGGRSVAIFGKLTAQIAYIEAMYRHRPTAIEKLKSWATSYPVRKYGIIGLANNISDCGAIRNLTTTHGVKIRGATNIYNSSIYTNAFIGAGTKIYSSIIARRAIVDNGTLLERCFIGEGSVINNFTAVDSLIFSNCELFNGEAASIFAAPYTVSHHKSSLLIAGMFSFFNAGSGSNQSNHLFKTGAVHQGVHRRGVKFASGAYVMLPAVEGAFTTVIGSHKKHHNTEDLPFSLLIGENGESWLHPAINLTSSGMLRDIAKWPQRDRRVKPNSSDIIDFDSHNPFITERIGRAIDILEGLLERGSEVCIWERIKIKRTWIERGIMLYRLAWDMYIGRMLEGEKPKVWIASTTWLDVAGQYMSREDMSELLDALEADRFADVDEFIEALKSIYDDYPAASYCWAHYELERKLGHSPGETDIAEAVERGKVCYAELKKMCDLDLNKDFSTLMQIGYGIDWGEEEQKQDFMAVRM